MLAMMSRGHYNAAYDVGKFSDSATHTTRLKDGIIVIIFRFKDWNTNLICFKINYFLIWTYSTWYNVTYNFLYFLVTNCKQLLIVVAFSLCLVVLYRFYWSSRWTAVLQGIICHSCGYCLWEPWWSWRIWGRHVRIFVLLFLALWWITIMIVLLTFK